MSGKKTHEKMTLQEIENKIMLTDEQNSDPTGEPRLDKISRVYKKSLTSFSRFFLISGKSSEKFLAIGKVHGAKSLHDCHVQADAGF
jgi:hypothetical protein